jgi:hypothetical protein
MNIKEKAGDLLIDVAKLIIGGVVLASIITENINTLILYIGGISFALGLILAGFYLYKRK